VTRALCNKFCDFHGSDFSYGGSKDLTNLCIIGEYNVSTEKNTSFFRAEVISTVSN
jgi:hypothetical protein